jgi:hypothetical protein
MALRDGLAGSQENLSRHDIVSVGNLYVRSWTFLNLGQRLFQERSALGYQVLELWWRVVDGCPAG